MIIIIVIVIVIVIVIATKVTIITVDPWMAPDYNDPLARRAEPPVRWRSEAAAFKVRRSSELR